MRWAMTQRCASAMPARACTPEEAAEATRLRAVMDEVGCVNIFLAEGAGISLGLALGPRRTTA